MKRVIVLVSVIILLALFATFDPFNLLGPDVRLQRLAVLRSELVEYAYYNNKLPESLHAYFSSGTKSVLRYGGELRESRVVDYSGGWYYDPIKKVVGINDRGYDDCILSLDMDRPMGDKSIGAVR